MDCLSCTDVQISNCRGYTDSGQGGDGFHINADCTCVSFANCLAYSAVKGSGFAIGLNAGYRSACTTATPGWPEAR